MRDPSMIVLLVIGGMASGVAFLLVAGPAELLLGVSLEKSSNPVAFAVLAVALLASTFVSTFFTGAVVAAAMERADGGDPDVSSALAAAWARRGPLLAWAAFATAVGLALRALERWGVAGLLVRVLAGAAWTVGTWFAVPVIMAEGTMPIDTVRRSVDVLSTRFGTNVRATVRFGLEWLLVYVGIIAVAAFGVVVAFFQCSSAAVYQPNGHAVLAEDAPLGDSHRAAGMESYSISKIVSEALAGAD